MIQRLIIKEVQIILQFHHMDRHCQLVGLLTLVLKRADGWWFMGLKNDNKTFTCHYRVQPFSSVFGRVIVPTSRITLAVVSDFSSQWNNMSSSTKS